MKKAVSLFLLFCICISLAVSATACSGSPDPAALLKSALESSPSPDSVEIAIDILGDNANTSINYYIGGEILGVAAKSTIEGESFDEKLFIDSKQQLYHMQRLYGLEIWKKTTIAPSEFTSALEDLKAVFSPDTLIPLFSSLTDSIDKIKLDGTLNYNGTDCYKISFRLKPDIVWSILENAGIDNDAINRSVYTGVVKTALNSLDMHFYIGKKDKLCHGISIDADNLLKLCKFLGIDLPESILTGLNVRMIIKYQENSLVLAAGARASIHTNDFYSLFADSKILKYLREQGIFLLF